MVTLLRRCHRLRVRHHSANDKAQVTQHRSATEKEANYSTFQDHRKGRETPHLIFRTHLITSTKAIRDPCVNGAGMRNDTGVPNRHCAHLLALDPRLFPNPHQRRSKCLCVRQHNNCDSSGWLKRTLKTVQCQWADGTTQAIKQESVTDVREKVFHTVPNEGKCMIFDMNKSHDRADRS
jgi:hypothetical protein